MNASPSTTLVCALRGFLIEYVPRQRGMSPHTLHSYRDSLKLLLQFVAAKDGDLSQITFEQLSAERIAAFLSHLETKRRNQASTRNVRLSAIHSFFRYLGSQAPEHLDHVQRVLSIPFKRTGTREIQHAEYAEIQAILRGIDRNRPAGRRDVALIGLMFNTGGRVSEIVGLQARDVRLSSSPSVLLRGKGRKDRVCPIWPQTAQLVQTRSLRPLPRNRTLGGEERRTSRACRPTISLTRPPVLNMRPINATSRRPAGRLRSMPRRMA